MSSDMPCREFMRLLGENVANYRQNAVLAALIRDTQHPVDRLQASQRTDVVRETRVKKWGK